MAPAPAKKVISASRRTDIPAFYMDWFMESIANEEFTVINPYSRRASTVDVKPGDVDTIVFWSKNFGPLLENEYDMILEEMGFHLFFQFTINSDSPLLEPNIPSMDVRLNQLEALASRHPVESIMWRFDPICFFRLEDGQIGSNLDGFCRIARKASGIGIKRCTTSFLDHYQSVKKRAASTNSATFLEPALEQKSCLLHELGDHLNELGIALQTCCEKEVMDVMPSTASVESGACIPGDFLMDLFGSQVSLRKDPGQRVQKGCGCSVSTDIGSYSLHPCYHNCLFCYANPAPPDPAYR